MTELVLAFKRLRAEAKLPTAAHPGDAGLDLSSVIEVEVAAGERAMVPTGVAVAIPEGFAGLVLPLNVPAGTTTATYQNLKYANETIYGYAMTITPNPAILFPHAGPMGPIVIDPEVVVDDTPPPGGGRKKQAARKRGGGRNKKAARKRGSGGAASSARSVGGRSRLDSEVSSERSLKAFHRQ